GGARGQRGAAGAAVAAAIREACPRPARRRYPRPRRRSRIIAADAPTPGGDAYGTEMDMVRRLPASAGAEWLLGGFALLKRAPLALGTLGALWGLLGTLVLAVAAVLPALAAAVQLVVAIAGPLLFAGLVWAVREVQQGRPALPAHLARGLQDGHMPGLLATLLPQVVAGLLLGILLLGLVGPEQLQRLSAVSEELNAMAASGVQPSPEQVQEMIAGL